MGRNGVLALCLKSEMPDFGETKERVPPHLRRFVVQQDYDAYTAIDHAVWRFALLQMHDRFEHEAHAAYARGLAQTGMSVERIPRIDEMDACLRAFGWGAVCVDGFIPPRAFQAFQTLSILPIAAAIRRAEHLPYTPAPDIIHEAAGHAPILPDPEYAEFLRRIGDCGMRAFASRRDAELYEAIYRLSVVKEQRDAGDAAVADAERALASLVSTVAVPSEAARLARLYWWTVEYGLVGNVGEYKLYGAGLLSSLAESFFCHDASVRKLSLGPECVEVDYDITRPQPQLFVARDFAQLSDVLDQVCSGMAFRTGGLTGLLTARDADEVASIELDSGMHATGKIVDVVAHGGESQLVVLRGDYAFGEHGKILAGYRSGNHAADLAIALGRFADGSVLARLSPEELRRRYAVRGEPRVRVRLAGDLELEGCIEHTHAREAQGVRLLMLRDARVARGAQILFDQPAGRVAMVAGERVIGVRAGAIDSDFWPGADYSDATTPAPQIESPRQHARRVLYERVANTRGHGAGDTQSELACVHTILQRDDPEEWLLRWNLLERLTELDLDPSRRETLARELWRLEHELGGRHPIAMGLRYLGYEQQKS
jgi:phenylalanine-4-hydroxylase